MSTSKPTLHFLLSHPIHFLALGAGSGLVSNAPGTAGSLFGLALFWILTQLLSRNELLFMLVLLFGLGIPLCAITGKKLGEIDHPSIVWDEIVAMMLVLVFTPLNAWWWLLSFAMFRLFDIMKPYPIHTLDRQMKNGLGVMLDDLLAAGYTLLCVGTLRWLTS